MSTVNATDDQLHTSVRRAATWLQTMHLFDRYADLFNEPELAATARNMADCLLGMQAPDGGFPFYRYVPPVSSIDGDRIQQDTRFPNDNGKVLELLAYDHHRRTDPSSTRQSAVSPTTSPKVNRPMAGSGSVATPIVVRASFPGPQLGWPGRTASPTTSDIERPHCKRSIGC